MEKPTDKPVANTTANPKSDDALLRLLGAQAKRLLLRMAAGSRLEGVEFDNWNDTARLWMASLTVLEGRYERGLVVAVDANVAGALIRRGLVVAVDEAAREHSSDHEVRTTYALSERGARIAARLTTAAQTEGR